MIHTPGPWRISPNVQFPSVLPDSARASVLSHAGVYIADCGDNDSYMSKLERYANARLIAAAPELLRVLQATLEYIKIEAPRSPLAADAEAIIARATGN